LAALTQGAPALAAPPAASSCVTCHANPDLFDGARRKIVDSFRADVHAAVGISCQDCHGGNPDPKLAEDPGAMDPKFASNPYRGAPKRTDVPRFCGRCHSDPEYMKRFRPGLRVDQEREYATSVHGKLLAQGDTKVATCVDCHGVHGILRPSDPRSPVFPKHVAETCSTCHGDPKRMAGYTLADGRPLPVDQYARWRRSVHAAAMFDKGDLTAPTCNDCHGNHGATPPGVESVAFVCGQCHGREAELFRASAKHAGFQGHNGLLAGAGGKCAACHEPPEPQASLTTVHSFTECVTCHENHAVVRPTVAMLSPLPAIPCAFCHEGPGRPVGGPREPEATRRNYQRTRDGLLAAARAAGVKGDALFDWMVDRAVALPNHLEQGEEKERRQRPEFARLFTKFRIGRTYYTYQDPVTGKEARAAVVRCSQCHSPSPALAGAPLGLEASDRFLTQMRDLTALTGSAERTLLAARRGGVETRSALTEIDQAVDAQIELEVLVHTFASAPGGAFEKKHQEGVTHARAALAAGQKSLGELAYRRRGLAVSLGFIGLVLVGLAWKIREISQ
ncbi:MAG TPA: hypothetical protein VFC23_13690, partial [Thermoanaerobaculia bacterium]|nr:hypothetical protein [Thermoanaerobaculia bacterium]